MTKSELKKDVLELISLKSNKKLPAILHGSKWMASAWEKTTRSPTVQRSGRFTAMIGYEWTVMPAAATTCTANVVPRRSRHAKACCPDTSRPGPGRTLEVDGNYEEKTGGRLLAIPHNGNLVQRAHVRKVRFDGSPMTRGYAEARAKWEPLSRDDPDQGAEARAPVELSPEDEFAGNGTYGDDANLNGRARSPA